MGAHIDGQSDPAVGAVVGVHVDDQVGGRHTLDSPVLQVDAACGMPASLLVSASTADLVDRDVREQDDMISGRQAR